MKCNRCTCGLLTIVLLVGFALAAEPKITGFWFNGGWDHYESDYMQYVDEFIIFAIAPDPETGGLNTFSINDDTGEVTYRRRSGAGLSTSMLQRITADADQWDVRTSIGINGMGRKDAIFNRLVENGNETKFAQAVREFCLKWGIDNVDVDYEHPADDDDVVKLTAIIRSLHDMLNPLGITVSITVGPGREFMQKFVRENHNYVSAVNLMSYLHPYSRFVENLELYHDVLGVPREKLFGGIGFYAKLMEKKTSLNYRDLLEYFDDGVIPDTFSLPDPDNPDLQTRCRYNMSRETLTDKLNYLKTNQYGGVMIWALNHDVPAEDDRSMLKFVFSEMKR